MTKLSSAELFVAIKSALTAGNYQFESDERSGLLDLKFAATKFIYELTIFCGDGIVVFAVRLPLVVTAAKRFAVLEALNLASFKTPCGGYELTLSNQCQFKYGYFVRHLPSKEETQEILNSALAMIDAIALPIEGLLA